MILLITILNTFRIFSPSPSPVPHSPSQVPHKSLTSPSASPSQVPHSPSPVPHKSLTSPSQVPHSPSQSLTVPHSPSQSLTSPSHSIIEILNISRWYRDNYYNYSIIILAVQETL